MHANLVPGHHDDIKDIEHLDKTIVIDQSPIGRTPRSNPATYTGLLCPFVSCLRRLLEAKIRGYKAGRFSFNVKGGRCENCRGDHIINNSKCTFCLMSMWHAKYVTASAITAKH